MSRAAGDTWQTLALFAIQLATNMTVQNYTVASSAIAALAYDDETETLFITFHSGHSYEIAGFPEIEFARFVDAPSKGGYWNSFVKGNY